MRLCELRAVSVLNKKSLSINCFISSSSFHSFQICYTWEDAKSQKGAYKVLKNAKACADKNEGYSVFDWNGNIMYAPTKASEPE